jgi:hypothetical protein
MNEKPKRKKKLKGWLIAVIVVVAVFGIGAICCYTFGGDNTSVPQASVSASK